MERIEIGLKDLFRKPEYLTLMLDKLNKGELYALIGCSCITLVKLNLDGKDIEFNKPDEIKQTLQHILKNVEKDLISSYNICGK